MDSQMLPPPPPAATPAPTLLSVAQVAARTGASVGFWRRELRLRRLRAYRLGDLVRIAEADLATYIAQREARQ